MGILATVNIKRYESHFDRDSFYAKFIKTETRDGLTELCGINRKASVRTDQQIDCGQLPFGISIKGAIKINGRPNFRKHIKKSNLEILIFRKKHGPLKLTQVFYFHSNRLLAGQLILSRTSYIHLRKLLDSIELKYFGMVINGDALYHLKDSAGNRLSTKQAFNYTVTYLSNELLTPVEKVPSHLKILRVV